MTLTVTGTFADDGPAPRGAIAVVQLLDVARADAPATVLGEAVVEDLTTLPVPFRLVGDGFDARSRLTVSCRVTVDDRLVGITDTFNPVDPFADEGEPAAEAETLELLLVRVPDR